MVTDNKLEFNSEEEAFEYFLNYVKKRFPETTFESKLSYAKWFFDWVEANLVRIKEWNFDRPV